MFSEGIEMEHGLKWDNVLVGVVSELHVSNWKSKTFTHLFITHIPVILL